MFSRQASSLSRSIPRHIAKTKHSCLQPGLSSRRTMATASHVELTPSTAGVYHAPDISSQSAKVASDLLQENHDSYHIFFNQSGFHNHIAHHLLAIYALGASPQELQKAYDDNKGYQRKLKPVQQKNVEDMSDRKKFKEFLGKEKYFHDYEAFFQTEIDAKGWQSVLQEQLFAGDEHAEDMLIRMYAGEQTEPARETPLTAARLLPSNYPPGIRCGVRTASDHR